MPLRRTKVCKTEPAIPLYTFCHAWQALREILSSIFRKYRKRYFLHNQKKEPTFRGAQNSAAAERRLFAARVLLRARSAARLRAVITAAPRYSSYSYMIIASAAMPAVSVRRIILPRLTICAGVGSARSLAISSSAKPPSGPMMRAIFRGGMLSAKDAPDTPRLSQGFFSLDPSLLKLPHASRRQSFKVLPVSFS